MKFIAYYDSPLGKITLAGDEAGLCGLWFEGEKYYAHALAVSGADGKFCMRDIAAKTDATAREGCYERGEKRSSADLLAKEQHVVSETQRDIAALKKSEKSDIAAEATNGADGKFCAHTLIASEKFFTRDFAVKDTGKKPRVTNLSAQGAGEKFCVNEQSDTLRRKIWPFSIKLGAGSICILADASRVLRPL